MHDDFGHGEAIFRSGFQVEILQSIATVNAMSMTHVHFPSSYVCKSRGVLSKV